MKLTLEIQRFNPETDSQPSFKSYTVDVEPTDRILDALLDIKRNQDPTLAFRKSCAHGVCGSDAMRIAGREKLACKTLVQDVVEEDGKSITIEPLRHFSVQRDLMIDQGPFFDKYKAVHPFFIPKQKKEGKEYVQSQKERAEIDDATKCILCQACVSACPVMDKNPDFIGPAAIVQAARFVFDSRDEGFEERLGILDHPDGVWSCENHFECTRVCPREIKVTKLINLTKRRIKKYREDRGEQTAEEKAGGAS